MRSLRLEGDSNALLGNEGVLKVRERSCFVCEHSSHFLIWLTSIAEGFGVFFTLFQKPAQCFLTESMMQQKEICIHCGKSRTILSHFQHLETLAHFSL